MSKRINQAWLNEAIWAHENDEFDGLTVSDTSEVPDNYRGQVLHINDHGNVTLYEALGKVGEVAKLREIASRV